MPSGTETRSVVAVIAIAITVSGCGGSSKAGAARTSRPTSTSTQQPSGPKAPSEGPEPGPTRRRRKHAADIVLSSPAITPARAGNELAREFTCDGADRSPALRWRGVPSNAAELTLFVVSVKPVNHKLFFDWAVAGLSPKLHSLESGRLPPDTVVGRNGFGRAGYSICPSAGAPETYFFELYAPAKRVAAQRGFEPLALRNQVAQSSHGVGLLIAEYARG